MEDLSIQPDKPDDDGDSSRPPSLPPRVFEFVVGKRFTLRRRLTAVVDGYMVRPVVRSAIVSSIVIIVVGITASVFVGPGFLVLAAIGVASLLVTVIVRPLQILRAFAKGEGRGDPVGSKYAAAYGAKGFKVRLPSGILDSYRYEEMALVHTRGQFVVFSGTKSDHRTILPIGVVPKGDVSWLNDRVREGRHTEIAERR